MVGRVYQKWLGPGRPEEAAGTSVGASATSNHVVRFDQTLHQHDQEGRSAHAGGSHEWMDEGATLVDARAGFHFYATGITPAMAKKIIGKGSKYGYAYTDAEGTPFDGSKTYQVHVPPDVPAKEFWSFTLYDNQTRSMLQTDNQFPGIDNNRPGMIRNADGSYDVDFAPEAPMGQESNWVQTVPGRGWNVMFRLYGPLEPWFDKTWRPGEPELVK